MRLSVKYKVLFICLILISARAFAYEEFIANVDKCSWIPSEQKKIFKMSPPFMEYVKEVTEQFSKNMQKENEIDLDKAKLKAIKFYEKYLAKMPELLKIAKEVIEDGKYLYDKNANDSQMRIIIGDGDSWSTNVRDELFEKSGKIKEGKDEDIEQRLNEVLSGRIYEKDKLNIEIEHRYTKKEDITKNFGIEVLYNDDEELPIRIIHEAAHVLDIAYRIIKEIKSDTVLYNYECISMFFETVARREFNAPLVDKRNLIEIYRDMVQNDYLRRVKDCKGLDIESIIKKVKEAWHSELDENVNYIDLGEEATQAALDVMLTGGKYSSYTNDYLPEIVRTLEVIEHKAINGDTIEGILREMITDRTTPLYPEGYEKVLQLMSIKK